MGIHNSKKKKSPLIDIKLNQCISEIYIKIIIQNTYISHMRDMIDIFMKNKNFVKYNEYREHYESTIKYNNIDINLTICLLTESTKGYESYLHHFYRCDSIMFVYNSIDMISVHNMPYIIKKANRYSEASYISLVRYNHDYNNCNIWLKIKLLIDILPLDLINYIGITIYRLYCGKNTIYNISNMEMDTYDISITSDNDIEKLFMTIIDNVMCLKYRDKKIEK